MPLDIAPLFWPPVTCGTTGPVSVERHSRGVPPKGVPLDHLCGTFYGTSLGGPFSTGAMFPGSLWGVWKGVEARRRWQVN